MKNRTIVKVMAMVTARDDAVLEVWPLPATAGADLTLVAQITGLHVQVRLGA